MQTDIFEYLYPRFKIDKPIRLIELFAGIGSQAKALERLGADFEHYKVVEFDKYAIKSYNSIHGTNFETSDITQIHASDLEICESDRYTYILTYSFPCQDLSIAGKRKGMGKASGTRSGLLWEVERLLDECDELPQVLLMENVPDVIGEKNIRDFNQWQSKLESLGYSNYMKILNAKDYGIPQNRKRCFMISIHGKYYYEFPKPFELKLRLRDMLEDKVDEKYYLSEKGINLFKKQLDKQKNRTTRKDDITILKLAHGYDPGSEMDADIIPTITTGTSTNWHTVIKEKPKINVAFNLYDMGVKGFNRANGDVLIQDGLCKTIDTMQGGNRQPKILVNKNDTDKTICLNSKGGRGGVEGLQPSLQDRIYDSRGISPACATSYKPSILIPEDTKKGYKEAYCGDGIYINRPHQKRGTVQHGMIQTLKTSCADVGVVTNNSRIRKLTPLECYRLMGFDDEDFYKAELVNSNTQLYKQAGNSIVVNVLEAIFKMMVGDDND